MGPRGYGAHRRAGRGGRTSLAFSTRGYRHVHPPPFPPADSDPCTATKTLRGPRGGIVLTNREDWFKKIQDAVFPGVQGSLHSQILAAKAICLGEALRDDFKTYAAQVRMNARRLAETLSNRGVRIVSGGT